MLIATTTTGQVNELGLFVTVSVRQGAVTEDVRLPFHPASKFLPVVFHLIILCTEPARAFAHHGSEASLKATKRPPCGKLQFR